MPILFHIITLPKMYLSLHRDLTTSTLIHAEETNSFFNAGISTPLPNRSIKPSKTLSKSTPIIAGVVAGTVGLSIMTFAIWLCCRRRQEKRRTRRPKHAVSSKDFDTNRSFGRLSQEHDRLEQGRHLRGKRQDNQNLN